jgi:prepilin peptidase CpaA
VEKLLSPPLVIVVCAVLVTAIIDLWKFKIHNAVTLPLLLSGVAYHGVTAGAMGVVDSLLGAVFGMVIVGVFYLMGGMGGGDVKLLGAIGAWLLLPMTFWVFIASSIASGIYAVILIVVHKRYQQTWVNLKIIYYRLTAVARHLAADDHVEVAVNKDDRRARLVPFAPMVALGVIVLLIVAWYFDRL